MMRRTTLTLLPCLLAGTAAGADLAPISSSEVCGNCHRAIHTAWKASAHARAMESRLFQDALELAEGVSGPSAKKVCLGCHAPLALRTGDLALKQKVSWEGVTCDYCHSVRSVSTGKANPEATLEFSLVKSGPLQGASSPAHGAVFSDVHVSSLVCAPCHEYRNPQGLQVLTTYSEWQESRYGKEKAWCQSCHMGRVAGAVVDPRVKASAGAMVNLHEMPGSRSVKQLAKAIQTRMRADRKGDKLEVAVEVANVGAGHYVPTGSPIRQLILDVTADHYGGKGYRETRVYRRAILDRDGKAITHEHRAFLEGARVESDTRLAPGERRTENFSFAIPGGAPVQLKARLSYYYSPMAAAESEQRVVVGDISRLVK
ncbi:MAG: hypothetical protein KIT09_08655 [Bryobacteraceae bacterium]|nr:hypothetical protein [Bryobacteraceae bacterium]